MYCKLYLLNSSKNRANNLITMYIKAVGTFLGRGVDCLNSNYRRARTRVLKTSSKTSSNTSSKTSSKKSIQYYLYPHPSYEFHFSCLLY